MLCALLMSPDASCVGNAVKVMLCKLVFPTYSWPSFPSSSPPSCCAIIWGYSGTKRVSVSLLFVLGDFIPAAMTKGLEFLRPNAGVSVFLVDSAAESTSILLLVLLLVVLNTLLFSVTTVVLILVVYILNYLASSSKSWAGSVCKLVTPVCSMIWLSLSSRCWVFIFIYYILTLNYIIIN